MAITLIHTDRRPSSSQFGLDSFTEIYKANAAANLVAIDASVPQRGDVHPEHPFMFVTDRHFNESGSQACACDIIYTGCLKDDGAGNPTLPPQKPTSGGQIASATTNTDADIFPATVTNPATVEFYAITNTLSFFSTDPDDASEPEDPPEITSLISWDLGFGLQPGISMPALVTYLLTSAFSQGIIEEPPTVEPIVDGQFYQITKRKTRTLFPYAPPA